MATGVAERRTGHPTDRRRPPTRVFKMPRRVLNQRMKGTDLFRGAHQRIGGVEHYVMVRITWRERTHGNRKSHTLAMTDARLPER